MKKMKTYILGMVLAFAMILLPQNVSAATQIPVTAVEDITDVMAVVLRILRSRPENTVMWYSLA